MAAGTGQLRVDSACRTDSPAPMTHTTARSALAGMRANTSA